MPGASIWVNLIVNVSDGGSLERDAHDVSNVRLLGEYVAGR
jgi:hypothetical protein